MPAFAMDLSEFLRIKMLQTYDTLNTKVGQCHDNRQVIEKQEIKSVWFNYLSYKQKGPTILLLSQMTLNKCIATEEANYSRALLSYVAETGDNERLDNWLALKRIYKHKDQQAILDKLDLRQIDILSDTPPFDKPFDPLQVLDLYIE